MVAVLATRGLVRRVVGVVLALAGVGLVWRAIAAAGAVSARRARALVVESAHPTVDARQRSVRVDVHSAWAVLGVVCGVLVLVAGALVAWRGHAGRRCRRATSAGRPRTHDRETRAARGDAVDRARPR